MILTNATNYGCAVVIAPVTSSVMLLIEVAQKSLCQVGHLSAAAISCCSLHVLRLGHARFHLFGVTRTVQNWQLFQLPNWNTCNILGSAAMCNSIFSNATATFQTPWNCFMQCRVCGIGTSVLNAWGNQALWKYWLNIEIKFFIFRKCWVQFSVLTRVLLVVFISFSSVSPGKCRDIPSD